MKQNKIVSNKLYGDIKAVLEKARSTALRSVNFLMVEGYWHMGRLIVEEEQKGKKRAEYEKYLYLSMSHTYQLRKS